jgi:hypothetical protein
VLDYRDNDPQEGLSRIVSGIQVIQTRVLWPCLSLVTSIVFIEGSAN